MTRSSSQNYLAIAAAETVTPAVNAAAPAGAQASTGAAIHAALQQEVCHIELEHKTLKFEDVHTPADLELHKTLKFDDVHTPESKKIQPGTPLTQEKSVVA